MVAFHIKPRLWRLSQVLACLVAGLAPAAGRPAYAQATTRLLLSNGTGAPGHTGFVFGPFSSLAMNESKDVVFLSSLRSARIELRAIVRSTGVTFSVVAFQGLRSPVPRTTYDSFSAPSLNSAGDIVFAAQLKDEAPASAVIRAKGGSTTAIVVSGDNVPGMQETTFQEFSTPLVSSAGNVLFSARTAGKTQEVRLFVWTPRGIQTLSVPGAMNPGNDLLEPVYFSHDEAVFRARGTSQEAAVEQFFRAVAVKSFQDINPPPELSETRELLPARPGETPVKMLLVLMEGDNVQMVPLQGDPLQTVMARRQAGVLLKPLGRVLGQTVGAGEKLLFAATSAERENDLGVYCYCDGQVTRLTAPEEFLPILQAGHGRPILSLAGDLQQTVAFIVPGSSGPDSTSIYVTSLP